MEATPREPNDERLKWNNLLNEALTKPGLVSKAFSQMHEYSMGNQMLAMIQCAIRGIEPGPIATFPKWKELNRYVKKGSKALMLCMPVTCKAKETKVDPETGNETEEDACFTRFIYRNNWFVLSQTDGEEYKAPATPSWDKDKALSALDIAIAPFTATNGNAQGYAHKREIAINPLNQDPLQTLLHEMAHIVLGHTTEMQMSDGEATPRSLKEVEAESVAYICQEALELPGAEYSRGYIQSWAHGAQSIPEKSAQKIFKAADTILRAGRN